MAGKNGGESKFENYSASGGKGGYGIAWDNPAPSPQQTEGYTASKGGHGCTCNGSSDYTGTSDDNAENGEDGFVFILIKSVTPTNDYYIAKKDNNYYLPVFGSKQVESSDYTVLNTVEYKTPGNYTWTCPEGVTKIRIILSGAGGGGGGGYDQHGIDSGRTGKNGTDGKLIDTIITVVPNTTYEITVGAGGAAGKSCHAQSQAWDSGTSGGNGDNSSFGSYTANGGIGGDPGSGGYTGGDSE